MKPILLFTFLFTYAALSAQPQVDRQKANNKFMTVQDKIKKVTSVKNIATMKVTTAVVLSPSKLKGTNDCAISFEGPDFVLSESATFQTNPENGFVDPKLWVTIPGTMSGTCVVEMNVGLTRHVENFQFKIRMGENVQLVTLPNNQDVGNDLYQPDKLVFAITIPSTGGHVEVFSKSAPWRFWNCEMTAMK